MKYLIDTENGTCIPYVQPGTIKTLDDFMKLDRGATEYEGAVKTIQEWFYGKLVKAAWCATAICYYANECGILDQLGGKNDNVSRMLSACEQAHEELHKGQLFYDTRTLTIEKGDILFWLWDGSVMADGSSKHVGVSEYRQPGQKLFCLGGNQKDKICTLEYDRKYLYAVFRPDYG